ncbi:MAG: L,D-transpeptidase [Candidatus Levyibacteriota bacterium]
MAKKKKARKKNNLWRFLLLFFVGIVAFFVTKEMTTSLQQPATCANSQSCTSDLSLKIENNVTGMFEGKVVVPPTINSVSIASAPVLGAQTGPGEKHIYVDLSTQTLYAFQGTTQIFKTLISSGKWQKTPTGNFHIWEKLLATRMKGGEGADAYDLPNVPYVMYFYHDFGLHGAYWHDNFGYPMSHGCVNMRQVDAKTLFDWTDGPDGTTLGTAVSVCDQITSSNVCVQNDPVE